MGGSTSCDRDLELLQPTRRGSCRGLVFSASAHSDFSSGTCTAVHFFLPLIRDKSHEVTFNPSHVLFSLILRAQLIFLCIEGDTFTINWD